MIIIKIICIGAHWKIRCAHYIAKAQKIHEVDRQRGNLPAWSCRALSIKIQVSRELQSVWTLAMEEPGLAFTIRKSTKFWSYKTINAPYNAYYIVMHIIVKTVK